MNHVKEMVVGNVFKSDAKCIVVPVHRDYNSAILRYLLSVVNSEDMITIKEFKRTATVDSTPLLFYSHTINKVVMLVVEPEVVRSELTDELIDSLMDTYSNIINSMRDWGLTDVVMPVLGSHGFEGLPTYAAAEIAISGVNCAIEEHYTLDGFSDLEFPKLTFHTLSNVVADLFNKALKVYIKDLALSQEREALKYMERFVNLHPMYIAMGKKCRTDEILSQVGANIMPLEKGFSIMPLTGSEYKEHDLGKSSVYINQSRMPESLGKMERQIHNTKHFGESFNPFNAFKPVNNPCTSICADCDGCVIPGMINPEEFEELLKAGLKGTKPNVDSAKDEKGCADGGTCHDCTCAEGCSCGEDDDCACTDGCTCGDAVTAPRLEKVPVSGYCHVGKPYDMVKEGSCNDCGFGKCAITFKYVEDLSEADISSLEHTFDDVNKAHKSFEKIKDKAIQNKKDVASKKKTTK